MTEKIAVLAPIESASVRTTVSGKPGIAPQLPESKSKILSECSHRSRSSRMLNGGRSLLNGRIPAAKVQPSVGFSKANESKRQPPSTLPRRPAWCPLPNIAVRHRTAEVSRSRFSPRPSRHFSRPPRLKSFDFAEALNSRDLSRSPAEKSKPTPPPNHREPGRPCSIIENSHGP